MKSAKIERSSSFNYPSPSHDTASVKQEANIRSFNLRRTQWGAPYHFSLKVNSFWRPKTGVGNYSHRRGGIFPLEKIDVGKSMPENPAEKPAPPIFLIPLFFPPRNRNFLTP
jgi:hypothetical protein